MGYTSMNQPPSFFIYSQHPDWHELGYPLESSISIFGLVQQREDYADSITDEASTFQVQSCL
jgi:hypothetical protein